MCLVDRKYPILAALCCVLISLVSIDAQCIRYSVTVIQPEKCSVTGFPVIVGIGLNESGAVAGYRHTCGFDDRPFFWSEGTGIVTVTLPAATPDGRARDVNSAGQVVGWMHDATHGSAQRAFVAENGIGIDIGTLPGGDGAEAYGLNESGVVVGWSDTKGFGSGNHAFLYTKGMMTDLNLPVGPNNQARDVNEQNQVCGWMGNSASPTFGADAFFRESDGAVINIGEIINSVASAGEAINNVPQVCGTYHFPDGSGAMNRAFLWSLSDNSVHHLGLLLNSNRCFGRDVNDSSVVVGSCQQNLSNSRGYVWRNGIMLDLNEVISPFKGFHIVSARGINNTGQITGEGRLQGDVVAFVLTPMPGKMGDVNCDNLVNVDDLIQLIGAWGPCNTSPNPCHYSDLNADGIVNVFDLLHLLNNWHL